MANKKITELPTAGTLTGVELIELVQGGANTKTTAQDIANLGGGGSVQSVTGDGVNNLDPINPVIDLTSSRTLTSAGAILQSDNLHIVYANSGSPFNITVNSLTANTQVTVINIGVATVTLVAGAGVTLPGGTIAIATGENALIIFRVPTSPEVYTGNVSVLEITGLGTGVATALGVNIGSAGAVVVFNGAGGTPSSIVLTNASGLPLAAVTGLGTGVSTWLVTPSWTNFLAAITGTAPFWSLASGGTLTGVNTITSNTANQMIYAGTWTATADNQYHKKVSPTITGRAGSADFYGALDVDSSMIAGANNQTLDQLRIRGTFATGGFSGTINNYIHVKTTAGGNDIFYVRDGSMRIGQTGSTQNITISPNGSDNTIAATGGNDLKLSHSAVVAFTINSQDLFYIRAASTFGAQLLQAVTTATTNASTQRNSTALNFTSKMWSGSASFDDFFTIRATASTATNSEQYLDIYNGQSSNIPSLVSLGFRLKNNGDLLLGAGTATTATPSARVHVTGGGTTTGKTLLLEASDGTDKFTFVDNGDFQVDKTITAGGTTGDRTINKLAGTVNFAAAATAITVTNSLVTTSSLIFCTVRTNDTTATIKNVVPGSGSFVITIVAATGETSVGFFIVN